MLTTRRTLLAAAAGFALPAHAETIDARVGGAEATHPTLAAAIASAPGDRPFCILLSGRVREKVIIDRPLIELVGDGPGATLSYDAAAGMRAPDGEPWGTWRCATLIVRAPDFSARDLTIENAFDYLADLVSPRFERIGSNGAQAIALMLDEAADRTRLRNVEITGHQDTLFANSGRALFEECRISGSVDFIFGAGAAWFESCELRSRYRPLMQRNHGWVAVPSTARADAYGLVFHRCRLTREAQVPPASVALGRPWRPARQFADGRYGDPDALGMAAFLRCWMDDHISADGWDEMGYPNRGGGRVFLQPAEARLGEYRSEGPGAFVNRRRPQLPRPIVRASVLRDWRPA
ncbi:MAG: hypothetical protein JNJ73_21265 [Hyphomonadaceae bacterium]|nr:hypothetical protein [Hyphomonadaceae bacterium]